ncbi:inter-alpha-trypsin inhibitor heavy chain H6 [Latimeria chalumnae]|uniref:inter-alpha-trypsin inhibitor heavy chain H6 n=1 Tax=Latimeria chalumnae TaxID=7897 RepID=UPI00313AB22F
MIHNQNLCWPEFCSGYSSLARQHQGKQQTLCFSDTVRLALFPRGGREPTGMGGFSFCFGGGFLLAGMLGFAFAAEGKGQRDLTNAPDLYLERIRRQVRAPKLATKTELTITDFHVRSNIVSRYAFTTVQSVVVNPHPEAKEAVFDIDLPSSAFISNFTLTIKDKVYVAQVKEKIQAKKIYEEARKKGLTAAHVATRDRETEKFKVAVNVEARGQITFTLTYEELLQRRLGRYELSVSVRPQQVVENLTVEITLSERTGFEYVKVLPLRTSKLLSNNLKGDAEMPPSTSVEMMENCAVITFSPTTQEQAAFSSSGVMGDFVVQYDVKLKDLIGDVQIYNGYFVHYFAPRGLPTVPKNVIFVIDVSGSMYGTKLKQTKKAMHVILSDLRPEDYFNLVLFSDSVKVWKSSQSIQATPQSIKSAKDYVNKMEAEGWTDINSALLKAASLLNKSMAAMEKNKGVQKVPLIIFLTDGEPTAGVTSTNKIISNAKQALKDKISLFGIAFGDDADFGLMRRLSLENRGVARRIYEDADANLQLKGFYDEVASPLLYDIELNYLDNRVENVTRTLFPNYFDGSELVVAGKVKPGVHDLRVQMTASDSHEQINLENDIAANDTEPSFGCPGDLNQIQHFVQRLWAYFTIQELLQARIRANDTTAKRLLTEKATNLSLKYNFVTPVTSLVVVKPEDEEKTTPVVTTTTVASSTVSSAKGPSITKTIQPTTATPSAKKTTRASIKMSIRKTTKPTTTTLSATKAGVIPSMTTSSTKTALPTRKAVATTTAAAGTKKKPKPKFPATTTMSGTKPSHPQATAKSTATSQGTRAGVVMTAAADTSTTTVPTTTLSVPVTVTAPSAASTLMPTLHRGSTELPLSGVDPRDSTATLKGSLAGDIADVAYTELPSPVSGALGATQQALGPDDSKTLSAVETTDSGALEEMFPLGTFAPEIFVHPESVMLQTVKPTLMETLSEEYIEFFSILPQSTTEVMGVGKLRIDNKPAQYCSPPNPPPVCCDPSQMVDAGLPGDYDYDAIEEGMADVHLVKSGSISYAVDGDPHFMVKLPHSEERICFTVDGRPNDILQLVNDPQSGVEVTGHLLGAPPKTAHENFLRNYFDLITITVRRPAGNYLINVTMRNVTVQGEGLHTLSCYRTASLHLPGLTLSVSHRANVSIQIGNSLDFLVLLHHFHHPTYLQLDHVGFYVVNGKGFSPSAHGILDQFLYADINVTRTAGDVTQETCPDCRRPVTGVLRISGWNIPVTLVTKNIKDSYLKPHEGPCWQVGKRNIEKLIGGSYKSYLAPRM